MVDMHYSREDARFVDGHFGTDIDVIGDEAEPPVRDVPEEAVEHFQNYGWELHDHQEATTQDAAEPSATETDTADDQEDSETDFDAAAFVDRNTDPIDDDLRSGEYDGHLDAIEAAEEANKDRKTVYEVIESRRDDAAE